MQTKHLNHSWILHGNCVLLSLAVALVFGWLSGSLDCAYADWHLVWSDEFNAVSIDTSKWTFDIGTGPPYPGWGNNELEYYTSRPQNAYVSNGVLHVVAIKESYN